MLRVERMSKRKGQRGYAGKAPTRVDVKRECDGRCETEREVGNMDSRRVTCLGGNLLAGSASLETVLGAAADVLEVAHAAGTGGLSALGLLAPLVRARAGRNRADLSRPFRRTRTSRMQRARMMLLRGRVRRSRKRNASSRVTKSDARAGRHIM